MKILMALMFFLCIPGALNAGVPSYIGNSGETTADSPSPEWLNYTNGDKVTDIADDGDFLWVGTQGGGIVRLNKLTDELTFYDRANAGLPDNHIATVETDASGNLWIGSLNSGIGMLHGNTCTVYNSENSGLPYDVWNQAIETDADGNIWIGSLYDISKFDGTDWTSLRIGNLVSSNFWIADIEFNAQGDAWIGTSLGLYKLREDELIAYDEVNKGVNAIETDSDANLWIGTAQEGLFRYDGKEWTVFDTGNSELPSNSVYSIASDSKGNLWFGTWEGLAKFNGKDWQVFDSGNSGLPEDSVLSIETDAEENIWCGLFHKGLVKYDGTNWKHYDTSNSVFPGNFVGYIETDNQPNIWFGAAKGPVRFDGKNWIAYDSEDFGQEYVQTGSVGTDADGDLWMRAVDRGLRHNHLLRYDGETWTEIDSPLPKVQPWFIKADSQGILWFGSLPSGVFRFDGTSWTNYHADNSLLPSNYIRDIAFDSHGNVWIGTEEGLLSFDREANWTLYNTDNSELPYNTVATLEFDSKDLLWLGTHTDLPSRGGGLTRFDGNNWISYNRDNSGISSNRILDICSDDQGKLWIGTSLGGLVRYDRKEEWTVYDQSNSGIARDNVHTVAVDSHGNKWIGHNMSGLSLFREGGIVFADKDDNPSSDKGIDDLLTPEKIGDEEFAQYEIGDKIREGKFERYEIGDRIVCYHMRTIGSAIVEKDFLSYQFDKNTGDVSEKTVHWRDDLPECLPSDLLTLEQVVALPGVVRGDILFSALYFISPDSDVFPSDPVSENPCWIVHSLDKGNRVVTIIDAVTGEYLGEGVPPPGQDDAYIPGSGHMVTDELRISAYIHTDIGLADAVFHKGGESVTARGDRVIWGYFYADPAYFSWGSEDNPDAYVKIWCDVSGRTDVNFFHVSVPEITVFSACPWNGSTYDKNETLTMADRYVRHEYVDNALAYPHADTEDQDVAANLSLVETAEDDVLENVGFSQADKARLYELLSVIPEEVRDGFERKYQAWKKTWDNPMLQIHSNPGMFAKSEEYDDFLTYCEEKGKLVWPLTFSKYEQGDELVTNAIAALTFSEYSYVMDNIRDDNLKLTDAVPSQTANWVRYIIYVLSDI